MAFYVVEEKLSSTTKEKLTSGVLSIVISSGIIMLLWFLHITVPNPPFDVKQGVVILDFGLVDGGFGAPDQGGPSPTPPAEGGPNGEEGGSPTQAGGMGAVVTNDGANPKTVSLPPIDPPASTTPSVDPRLKNRLGKVGKRTGSGQPGDPKGWEGGSGNTGSGGTNNTGGVHGDGTGTRPGGKGSGVFSYKFTNYKLSSSVRTVNADGEGDIVCRVSVDCAGRPSVIEYGSRGTTYTGSGANMRAVFDYFLGNSTFTKVGERCPESGLVTLTVKTGY